MAGWRTQHLTYLWDRLPVAQDLPSDAGFFYVWLRRSLKPIFPDLFATLAVPKAEELVATPYRHGSKEKAKAFFLDGMTQAMHRLAEQAHPAFPVTTPRTGGGFRFRRRPVAARPCLLDSARS